MDNSRKYLYHTMRGILDFQRRGGSLHWNSEVKQGEGGGGIRLRILEAWEGGWSFSSGFPERKELVSL